MFVPFSTAIAYGASTTRPLCVRSQVQNNVEVVQAAYRSNATGRTIELPLSID